MRIAEPEIDQLLADAMLGRPAPWPPGWTRPEDQARLVDRAQYHGIAGIIAERGWALADWPGAVLGPLKEQAIAQAMWELRHREELAALLADLAAHGVGAVLLKGSALAYLAYPNPATRARGDSDLLVEPAKLDAARERLAALGFERSGAIDPTALQEGWSKQGRDGIAHPIDLHWQPLNAPALKDVLGWADCSTGSLPLPRLGGGARCPRRAVLLIHACIHRGMHVTAPYIVAGIAHYGGDRLIWAQDIKLLAEGLAPDDWREVVDLASARGAARICRAGLAAASRQLEAAIPDWVFDGLERASNGRPAERYFEATRPVERAWLDFRAIPGLRGKAAYLKARGLPSPDFIRGKYPQMRGAPLPLLYLRRMVELVGRRPSRSGGE